jgi:hypothetical protein
VDDGGREKLSVFERLDLSGVGGLGDVPTAASVSSGERSDGLEKLTDHGGFPGGLREIAEDQGVMGCNRGQTAGLQLLRESFVPQPGEFLVNSDENRGKLRGFPVELSEIDSAGWL